MPGPCLTPHSRRSTIQQNLNNGNVALEIACIHIGLREFVRRDRGIPLCGFQTTPDSVPLCLSL